MIVKSFQAFVHIGLGCPETGFTLQNGQSVSFICSTALLLHAVIEKPCAPLHRPLCLSKFILFNMPKKGKIGKNRQDKFYHLAKEQGFRSRAAFKLVQLNKRYDFLSGAARGVLDLCAAPGGWMQVARKYMPVNAPCIGIDLVPIRPVAGCLAIAGDITSDSTRSNLLRSLRESGSGDKVDVVLNDGSPNMGKSWLQDAYTQAELTLYALKLATEFLAHGGAFVTKVFRSNDYNSLLFVMHQLFSRVDATKPSASRAESAEIYVMCIGFKAPKSIDPRLLNPRHVFKEISSKESASVEKEKPDVFLNTVLKDIKKRKRNREGYADGVSILFKKVSILEFCLTSRPVALMADASQFSFEPQLMQPMGVSEHDAKQVANLLEKMKCTSSELLSCCEDLKVLARREFKLLLKWRSEARNELQKSEKLYSSIQNAVESSNDPDVKNEPGDTEEGKEDTSGSDGEEVDMDSDEDVTEELRKVKSDLQAAEKRKKRKSRKMENARQRKIDLNILMPNDESNGVVEGGESLFTLTTAKRGEKYGAEMADVALEKLDEVMSEEHESDVEDRDNVKRFKIVQAATLEEAETAQKARATEVESELNRWYKAYLRYRKKDKFGSILRESKEKSRLRQKSSESALAGTTVDENGDAIINEGPDATLVVDSDESSIEGEPEASGSDNDDEKEATSRDAALWFSRPVFQGMEDELSSSDDSDQEEVELETANDAGDGAPTENFHQAALDEAKRLLEKKDEDAEGGDEVEVVPQQKEVSNDSDDADEGVESDCSFHSSDYDADEKAELVAIGMRLRKSKKEMENILDEGYHRYTFDDPNDLPRWFADQDGTYRERQAPVRKEDVQEMKEYIKSLESRPTKREAEAKARRRARAEKKMADMRVKANSIAEQTDLPVNARMKAIEDVYRKAIKSGKNKQRRKVYQVVRPGGRTIVDKTAKGGRSAMRGARTVLVDRRLKSDKRGISKAKKRHAKK